MAFSAQRCCHIIAVSALAFGLAACGKTEDKTAGQQLDSAVQQGQQAAENAGQRIDEAASNAGARIDQATNNAGEQISEGAARAESAATDAMDKAGAALDDAGITAHVKADLIKEPGISSMKIDVETKTGVVTLTGSVSSDAHKTRAGEIAQAIKGVSSVNNQLEVKAG